MPTFLQPVWLEVSVPFYWLFHVNTTKLKSHKTWSCSVQFHATLLPLSQLTTAQPQHLAPRGSKQAGTQNGQSSQIPFKNKKKRN